METGLIQHLVQGPRESDGRKELRRTLSMAKKIRLLVHNGIAAIRESQFAKIHAAVLLMPIRSDMCCYRDMFGQKRCRFERVASLLRSELRENLPHYCLHRRKAVRRTSVSRRRRTGIAIVLAQENIVDEDAVPETVVCGVVRGQPNAKVPMKRDRNLVLVESQNPTASRLHSPRTSS